MPISKVLVIDDEEPIISMMKDILELFEIEMDGVLTGEEGLKLLQENEYDYVICDLNLPDMNGQEFYSRATEINNSVKDRFAFSSGMQLDGEVKEFCESHSIHYLAKPFRLEDIQDLFGL